MKVEISALSVECCSENGSRCCVSGQFRVFLLVIIRLEILNHRGKGLKIKHTNQGSQY